MMSGLIEMNAHMIVTEEAGMLMGFGVVVAALAIALAFGVGVFTAHWRYTLLCLLFAAVGVGMMIAGNRIPRVKQIKVCASGPVSIEQIATRYEVKDIDGKELTLWEK